MYFITDKAYAIAFMVLSLWCLGTWPVFFNVAERRGRLPQHTYIDYAISAFLVALLFAVTLGQIGDSTTAQPNFFEQLTQNNLPSVLIAMAGGVALCLGNICMQYSLVFVGISITEVISASLAVILGTTVNYYLDNCLNSAKILFPGVACFVVAVVLGSICHASNSADLTASLGNPFIRARADDDHDGLLHTLVENSTKNLKGEKGMEASSSFIEQADLESGRAVKVGGSTVLFGLGLAFFTGICYGFFSPLFNIATNDQFKLLKPGVPHLVVYTTFFYFSVAFLAFALLVNVYLLYRPVLGLPKSSISAYLRDWKGRELGILAGIVCGVGNGFQFMAGQAAGYAAADAVQALPLVGSIWGIFLFGEYKLSSRRTMVLLTSMLLMFTAAVTLLIASAEQR